MDYLSQQLAISDSSCIKLYGQPDGTARTHAGEIEKAGGWIDFAGVDAELAEMDSKAMLIDRHGDERKLATSPARYAISRRAHR